LALKPRTKKMRADSLVRFLLILCVAIILLQLVIRRSTPQMIDAIPAGYTTLPAAVTLLAATIAEVDVARTRPMRRLFDALGFLLPEIPSNGNSDDDPLARSVNSWEKRELAISKLQSGLNTGELEASVRIPESGVMFTLEPADWRGAAFCDQIIRSGVIRSSACEDIERHAGRRVLISKIELERLLEARKRRRPATDEAKCVDWLVEAMRASPNQRIKPKREWRLEAISQFGLSGRGFERAWRSALQESGATWDHPGRAPVKSSR
jgi:hypothetical protein